MAIIFVDGCLLLIFSPSDILNHLFDDKETERQQNTRPPCVLNNYWRALMNTIWKPISLEGMKQPGQPVT